MRDLIDDFESDLGKRIPKKWVICPNCEGDGAIGNPAFDGTSVDWWLENDPSGEDLDEYLHGSTYDVRCDECAGDGKVRELDYDLADQETLKEWESYVMADYDTRREADAERRYFGSY